MAERNTHQDGDPAPVEDAEVVEPSPADITPGGLTRAAGPGAPMGLLRDHLPGLEPDRHVSDWGRSELVDGMLDRTVYDFLYHYWFRVEVEGLDNVPADGPALLVSNRAGALPTDAAMIAKALRLQHRAPRLVHFATERPLGARPGLDMLLVKAGAVGAHPANLHRLLFDEGQVVLVFPEGAPAKPLRSRYRVRRFDGSALVGSALRARAPIVPVAVLGGEEAVPLLGRLPSPKLLGRLPAPKLPRLPLAPALPLPAKMRLRFLDPVDPSVEADERGLAKDLRALIQENLLEMVGQRRSVWLG